jgi:hypothetical protein
MSIANTAQAERWNAGEDVAYWLDNQARFDRMNAPFAAMILDAAGPLPGVDVLDVGADTVDRALASVRAALAEHADAEGVHLGAAVWLVQAAAS